MTKINNTTPDTQNYLRCLADIAECPKRLWLYGELPAERMPTVAIVGTRKPTSYGREMAYRLSYDLAKQNVIIVSGLAIGIDGIVHQAVLDAGGTTIAVLPTALTAIHPRRHHTLAQTIVTGGGALITEYEPRSIAYKSNFLARNRIVTGISDGLIIIEATSRSGTLSTARFALEQGKTVMAVPGNVTNPLSEGCNNLIKSGAALVTSYKDILHELGWQSTNTAQTRLPLAYSNEESHILQLLVQGIRDGDELQQKSGLPAATFNQTLTMLEISGKIRPLGANHWTIA